MANHQEQTRRIFYEEYHPTWKLHLFNEPVWIVKYTFDDSGPTNSGFDIVVGYLADYFGFTRDELRERLDSCGGFTSGRPLHRLKFRL